MLNCETCISKECGSCLNEPPSSICSDTVTVWFERSPNLHTCQCNEYYSCLVSVCINDRLCLIAAKMRSIITGRTNNYNYKDGKDLNLYEKHGAITYETICELFFESFIEGFNCPHCGVKMILGGKQQNSCSIDHIVSRFNGGKNNKENLQIVCSSCNEKKSRTEAPDINVVKGEA